MIITRTHASLVEVAHRAGKTLEFVQGQARAGEIAAERTADGWLMTRDDAEAYIKRERPT